MLWAGALVQFWHEVPPATDHLPTAHGEHVDPTNTVPAGHGILHCKMIRATQPASVKAAAPATEVVSTIRESEFDSQASTAYIPSGPARKDVPHAFACATVDRSVVGNETAHEAGMTKLGHGVETQSSPVTSTTSTSTALLAS